MSITKILTKRAVLVWELNILSRIGRIGSLSALAFIYVFSVNIVFGQTAMQDAHHNGVKLARAGKFDEALAILHSLHQDDPENSEYIYDLIVVYAWSGDPDNARRLYDSLGSIKKPSWIDKEVLTVFRALGEFDRGLAIIESRTGNDQDSAWWQLRKAQLLIDLGQFKKAREVLELIEPLQINNPDYLKIHAYLNVSSEKWAEALADYQKLAVIAPGSREAIDGETKALLHLGAASPLRDKLAAMEGAVAASDLLAAVRLRNATLLRFGEHAAKNNAERIMLALQALGSQLEILSGLVSDTGKDVEARQLKYDIVVSLVQLGLFEDAYQVYLSLTETGDVPFYVTKEAARAALEQRKPGIARDLCLDILTEDPGDYQTAITLFFAYIELEEYEEGYAVLKNLEASIPPFKSFSDSRQQYPNERYLEVQVLSAQARFYADQLQESWQRIKSLSENAPANSWLSQVAGDIALARGWPRKAHRLYTSAYLWAPDNYGAQTGLANSGLRLGDRRRAEELHKTLQEVDTFGRDTLRLGESLHWASRPYFWADLEYSTSEGPVQSGDSVLASGEILSLVPVERLRVSGRYLYNWSEIIEGEETLQKLSTGLEYQGRVYAVSGSVSYNDSTVSKWGGKLAVSLLPDDFWTFSLVGELFAESIPLRALYYGIDGDSLSGSATYRWHESGEISVNVKFTSFSDSNDRFESGLITEKKLIDQPRFDLDGSVELYGSTNSLSGNPYFNPENDLSVQVVLSAVHVTYRQYESSLVNNLRVGGGSYYQEGFGSDWIGHLGYEMRYSNSPRYEMSLGIEAGRRVYDGEPEPYTKIKALVHAKF